MAEQISLVNDVRNAVQQDESTRFLFSTLSAIANYLYPGAGFIFPLLEVVRGRLFDRPLAILLEELGKRPPDLRGEKQADLAQMVFRFMESARQGEYEHNLKVLAGYIAGELKEEVPDPGRATRIARKIENLSHRDLRILALSAKLIKKRMSITFPPTIPFVCSMSFVNEDAIEVPYPEISESLAELSNRNILMRSGGSEMGKTEEYYVATEHLWDLVDKAEGFMETYAQTTARSSDRTSKESQ